MQQALVHSEVILGREVFFADTVEGVFWWTREDRRYGPYARESDARDNVHVHLGD